MTSSPEAPGGVPTNVAVVARLRPLDAQDGEAPCLSVEAAGGDGNEPRVVFSGAAGGGSNSNNSNNNSNGAAASSSTLMFRFDHVHGPESTQEDVFQHCEPLIDGVLKGLNGTIMAYGQTGSGKTHTLIGALGDGEEGAGAGVVPRACRLLLQRLAAAEATGAPTTATATTTPIITMTVVEIYAERVRCLLGGGQNLPLKQEAGSVSGGGVRAEGAVEVSVPAPASSASASSARDPTSSLRTLQRALQRALSQRAVAATDMNQASSRSHCVVMLRLPRTGAKLCLVDLAGSERAGRTNAQGTALAEGAAINKSLSALAGVVSALAGVGGGGGGGDDGEAQAPQPQPQQQQGQQQQQHVPYRDSKLTRLLQDSLGGSARTVLLVCCSPARRDGGETLSSLRFASRARGVKCLVAPVGAAGITGVGEAGTAALLAAEVARLKARLREMGEGAGAATVVAAPPSKPLLPWLLRCASAAVLGAYLAWEGMVW